MKRIFFVCMCALLTGFVLFSCSPSDEQLQKQVNKALVSESFISGKVQDGVVTLNGTAKSEETKAAVENLVKDLEGIKKVVNNVEVIIPTDPVMYSGW